MEMNFKSSEVGIVRFGSTSNTLVALNSRVKWELMGNTWIYPSLYLGVVWSLARVKLGSVRLMVKSLEGWTITITKFSLSY